MLQKYLYLYERNNLFLVTLVKAARKSHASFEPVGQFCALLNVADLKHWTTPLLNIVRRRRNSNPRTLDRPMASLRYAAFLTKRANLCDSTGVELNKIQILPAKRQ